MSHIFNHNASMGCLFALIAVFTPRLALVLTWIFTPLVERAFNGFIVPILGLVFLPFTTLIYVLVYGPATALQGWDWLWVGMALMVDLAGYSASAYANKDRFMGEKKVEAKKVEDQEKEEVEEEEEE